MNYVLILKKQFNIHRSLQLDCKSRWNSSYHLIEAVLMYTRIITKINSEKHEIGINKKQTTKLSSIELDQDDWKILEATEFVLRPIVYATQIISGSKYPTLGISYFAIVQIREFHQDVKDFSVNDSKILHYLKSLLLKQVRKYFIDDDAQLEVMKIRFFFYFCILLKINPLYLKTYSYFDPIGLDCLTRERRECEFYITKLEEQHGIPEINDQADVNQRQSQINSQRKYKESEWCSITNFLQSVGKIFVGASSSVTIPNENKLIKMFVYGSLAQREYNSIVDGEKDSNIVSFIFTIIATFYFATGYFSSIL